MSPAPAPREDRRLFAIGIVLAAYVFFTLCDTAAKWLTVSGMPPLQVAFVRYATQLAFILGMALPREGFSVFRSSAPLLQVVRASMLLGMTAFNFFALFYLPLTVTSAMAFAMPLLITALSVPLLSEQVGWRRWAAILVGFAGLLIIIQPGGESFHWAVLLGFGSISCGALYFILTRKLAGTASIMSMQAYAGLVGTLALLPFALANWMWPQDGWAWIAFFGVGLAAMTGHSIAIAAHRFAPASVLAPFAYSQIIWMTLSSWLIFAEPPTVWLFVGAPIVIGSGLYIWLRERALAKPTTSPISPTEAEQREEKSQAG